MTTQLQPPFAYFGGKTTLGPRIAALLPPHQHYVEPFAGGLSVLLAKPPSKMETVSDLDGRLMLFWRVLRDRPADLQRVCALTPHSRAEYLACRDVDDDPAGQGPDGDLETARRVWVRLAQGRGGTQKLTGWRSHMSPHGSSMGMPGYLTAYAGRIAPVAERLARVSLESLPALDIIDLYGRYTDTVLYVDPPYLGSTRSGTNYLVDMPAAADHLQMLAALRAAPAAVLLSGYDNQLYRDQLAGWDRCEFSALANHSRNGSGMALPAGTPRRTQRTEVLWSNRPLAHTPGLWDAL